MKFKRIGFLTVFLLMLMSQAVYGKTNYAKLYLYYEDINTYNKELELDMNWRKEQFLNVGAGLFEKLEDKVGKSDFNIRLVGKKGIIEIPAKYNSLVDNLDEILLRDYLSIEDIYYRFDIPNNENYEKIEDNFYKKFPDAESIDDITEIKLEVYHDKSEVLLQKKPRLNEAINFYIPLPEKYIKKSIPDDLNIYRWDGKEFIYTPYKIITSNKNSYIQIKIKQSGTFLLTQNQVKFQNESEDPSIQYAETLATRGYIEVTKVFEADRPISRGEFIDWIGKALFREEKPEVTPEYYDVYKGSKFYDSIKKLAGISALDIFPSDHLTPLEPIKREEMVSVLARSLTQKAKPKYIGNIDLYKTYLDFEEISSEIKEELQILTNTNILEPDEDGNFNPKNDLTKGEAAELIVRLLDYIK